MAALKNEGKSLQETIAAKPTAAYDSKQAGSFIMGDVFTKLVWVPEPDFSFILPAVSADEHLAHRSVSFITLE